MMTLFAPAGRRKKLRQKLPRAIGERRRVSAEDDEPIPRIGPSTGHYGKFVTSA